MEAAAVLDRLAGSGGCGLAGNGDGPHAEFLQVTFDGGLAIAAVRGDRAWRAPGAAGDPLDRWRQLRPIGGGAVFDVVVEDDAVVVVGDLGFVPELHGAVDAAAREIVACAERTLAARSARIELRRELRFLQAKWPRLPGWRGNVLRLAVKTASLLMSAAWRLATRHLETTRGRVLGQMNGEGIAEPARCRYMIDFGSFAKLRVEGGTFGGRSGRSVQALHPWPGGEQVGEVLWLLRLVPGTTDASFEGTETIHGTACRRLAAHVDMERASAGSGEGLRPPPVGRFEELRALPVTVWIDGQRVRRIRFEQGSPARQLTTLDLWEFGVPVGELDWSRLPTFRSPGYRQERKPWHQRVTARARGR